MRGSERRIHSRRPGWFHAREKWSEFNAGDADEVEKEVSADVDAESAEGEAGDAVAVGEDDPTEDDAEVIDERSDGLVGELLAHDKHGAERAADEEEELRGQKDARHVGGERDLLRREAAEEVGDVAAGEYLGENDADGEDDAHHGDDGGERVFAFVFAALLAVAGEDADEGDGDDAAGEEVAHHVRQLEGGAIGVDLAGGAEEAGDVGFAHETDDAGEDGGGHQQKRGGEGGVGVREAEPAQALRLRGEGLGGDGLVVFHGLGDVGGVGGHGQWDEFSLREVYSLLEWESFFWRRSASAASRSEPLVHVPQLSRFFCAL